MSYEEKIGKYLKLNIFSSSNVSVSKNQGGKVVSPNEVKPIISKVDKGQLPPSNSKDKQTSLERDNDNDKDRDKENIIIKSLIYLNKANNEPNIRNFITRVPDYSKSDNQNERELYAAIDRVIQNKFIEQQSYSVSDVLSSGFSPNENSNSQHTHSYANIDKLICKSKLNNKTLEFIAIKAIIISLINLINERIKKLFKLNFSGDTSDIDCEVFHDIYNEFLIMNNIYLFLEKDFSLSFNCFKTKYEMVFSLSELFRDVFWDYIFKIKQLNCLFVNYFYSNKLQNTAYNAMKQIVKVLWLFELPLKKDIGEILEITSITTEKFFLATYVIEYKSQLLYPRNNISIPVNHNNNNMDMNKKDDVPKEIMLKESIDVNKLNLDEVQHFEQLRLTHQRLEEQKSYLPKKEQDEQQEHQEQQHQPQQIQTQRLQENQRKQVLFKLEENKTQSRSLSQEQEQKHIILQTELEEDLTEQQDECQIELKKYQSEIKIKEANCNHLPQKTNSNNQLDKTEILNEQFTSIDELYNYIVNDHSNSKKRNKKKGKRKNTFNMDDNNIQKTTNGNHPNDHITDGKQSNNSIKLNGEFDPIVEQFKLDLEIKNSYASNVQKIKPKISLQWLKSIISN